MASAITQALSGVKMITFTGSGRNKSEESLSRGLIALVASAIDIYPPRRESSSLSESRRVMKSRERNDDDDEDDELVDSLLP